MSPSPPPECQKLTGDYSKRELKEKENTANFLKAALQRQLQPTLPIGVILLKHTQEPGFGGGFFLCVFLFVLSDSFILGYKMHL